MLIAKRFNNRPFTPAQWAQQALNAHGWSHAHYIAVQCWTITPLDVFWVNALNWLNNRKTDSN